MGHMEGLGEHKTGSAINFSLSLGIFLELQRNLRYRLMRRVPMKDQVLYSAQTLRPCTSFMGIHLNTGDIHRMSKFSV